MAIVRGAGMATIMAAFGGLAACSSNDPASENYDPTLTVIGENLTRPPTEPEAGFVARGAVRDEAFPTFSRERRGATTQMSALEREIMEAELAAARAELQSNRVAAVRYRERVAELRALARNHGSETQRAIEN